MTTLEGMTTVAVQLLLQLALLTVWLAGVLPVFWFSWMSGIVLGWQLCGATGLVVDIVRLTRKS